MMDLAVTVESVEVETPDSSGEVDAALELGEGPPIESPQPSRTQQRRVRQRDEIRELRETNRRLVDAVTHLVQHDGEEPLKEASGVEDGFDLVEEVDTDDDLVGEPEPPPTTHDQRRRWRQRDELRELRGRESRAHVRIFRQQAELNGLQETNRRLAADLSRAHQTIDMLIEGQRAEVARLREQVAAMSAR